MKILTIPRLDQRSNVNSSDIKWLYYKRNWLKNIEDKDKID